MELTSICKEVIDLSRQVGRFLLEEAAQFQKKDIIEKGLNDLVSYVDKEAELRIVKRLSELVPEAGFIAEEGTGKPKSNAPNWIIDPLDGTTNFIHGLPFYAVSIALTDAQGQLLLGVIYEPNRDECFHAITGEKAYCNELEIKVSDTPSLSQSLLATGFPYYDFNKVKRYLSSVGELMQKCHGLRRIGSAALDLAYVACGRFEGFYEYNLNAWDVAAGALIVRQAGGQVSTFSGTPDAVFGREILAAGPIHSEMLTIIQKHFQQEIAI